jgi:FkbM family methyltransferase
MRRFVRRHPILRALLAVPLAVRRAWIRWREHPAQVVLDRFSDILRDNVVFEAREFGGTFSINPRSHLIRRLLQHGHYEPGVATKFFSFLNPDGDVLDVGANIGFFTIGGAKKLSTGRLLAAEPTSEAFNRLSENVERNGVSDRVILFKGLVGGQSGQAEVHYVPGFEEYSSINALEHTAIKNHQTRTETVPIELMDNLVRAHKLRPTLIKVDVEGGEFSVFEGAEYTLSTFRPVVICELWRKPASAGGHTGAEIIELFQKLNYVVRDLHDPLATPGLADVTDIVCIPRETFHSDMLN